MKKITLILAHLLLIIGLITIMPATKSPTTQVYANLTFENPEGDNGDKGGPDDGKQKPGSGPKEEPKDKESKSVISSIWGWIKSVVS